METTENYWATSPEPTAETQAQTPNPVQAEQQPVQQTANDPMAAFDALVEKKVQEKVSKIAKEVYEEKIAESELRRQVTSVAEAFGLPPEAAINYAVARVAEAESPLAPPADKELASAINKLYSEGKQAQALKMALEGFGIKSSYQQPQIAGTQTTQNVYGQIQQSGKAPETPPYKMHELMQKVQSGDVEARRILSDFMNNPQTKVRIIR